MNLTSTHPLTADALKRAARESATIRPDAAGNRRNDPLCELIPGELAQATAEVLALVYGITGRTITQGPAGFLFTAPAARAALRRWAVLNQEG